MLQILPKVGFADDDEEDARIFLRMLRTYRGLRFAEFNEADISELRNFNMLDAFVRLFLTNLVLLTQRGLARQYRGVEDNFPWLRGRIRFPEHIRRNAVNCARFHVAFDELTADRPENRLIHSAIHKLRLITHPDNHQLLHQLRICFSEVPRSVRPEVDWERHRIDRSMRHYDTVMAWVGLFLFHHGLATFSGQHMNQALLFPMDEIFEDFVADAFRRHQHIFRVVTQGPRKAFARIDGKDAFRLKPDITLVRSDEVQFVPDAVLLSVRRREIREMRSRNHATAETTDRPMIPRVSRTWRARPLRHGPVSCRTGVLLPGCARCAVVGGA